MKSRSFRKKVVKIHKCPAVKILEKRPRESTDLEEYDFIVLKNFT